MRRPTRWRLFLTLCATLTLTACVPLQHTPCGLRPVECVREVPHGGLIREATAAEAAANRAADLVIESADGHVEFVRVPQICHEFMSKLLHLDQPQSTDSKMSNQSQNMASKVPDGWIASAGVYQMDSSPPSLLHSFSGRWTVPPAPTNPARPETLYYFIGLEDRTQGKLTNIHQPVLTWGDETEGGLYPGRWHLWSWTCCPKNLTWHSPDVAGFVPGDTVFGTIEKVGGSTWRVDAAFRDATAGGVFRNTTLLSQVGGYNYNYADVTLEVYNVSTCLQMADGASNFAQLNLKLAGGQAWVPPTWYVTGLPTNCHAKVSIVNATSMAITSGSASG